MINVGTKLADAFAAQAWKVLVNPISKSISQAFFEHRSESFAAGVYFWVHCWSFLRALFFAAHGAEQKQFLSW